MAALALALCSSCAWGVADFLAGLKSRAMPVATVMLVAVATGLALTAGLVAVRGVGPPAIEFLAYGALSAVVGSIGLAAFYRGLAVGTMSVVAPIAATGAAVPLVFGLARGERPGAVQLAGAVLAVVGVVVASRERSDDEQAAGPRRDPRRSQLAPGTGLALVAAVGLGSFLVAVDAAAEGDFAWAILTNRAVSLGLVGAAVLVLRARLPVDGRDALPAVAVGGLETVANVMIALATTLGLVSLVGVLASLYPVVTVALARVVLGERLDRTRRLGTVGALAGVALIAAGTG